MSPHSAQVVQVCGAMAPRLGGGELQSEGSGLGTGGVMEPMVGAGWGSLFRALVG